MKKLFTLLFFSFILAATVGCNQDKKLPPEEVISGVLKAYCARMLECDKKQEKAISPGLAEEAPMTIEVCEEHMRKYISPNKDFSKLEVSTSQLKACTDKISSRECHQMLYGNPLKECAFLK